MTYFLPTCVLPKTIANLTIFILLLLAPQLKAQDLTLYSFWPIENSNLGFVSLSDNYPLSSHPDSIAIPDIQAKGIKAARYFRLDATYRKRFLLRTKIAETDQVFAYNYATASLATFPVKDLHIVARLNIYADDDNWPFQQEDYMLGFEIDENLLKVSGKDFSTVLFYVGKESPFSGAKLKPITWKKANAKDHPANTIKNNPDQPLPKYVVGNMYQFEEGGLRYYIRDLLHNNSIFARHVSILLVQTKKTIYEKIYRESEGISLAPLNFAGNNDDSGTINQWTGKLFKNKAMVILGFEYHSFGCPYMTILSQPAQDIYINCDNRH